MGARHFGFKEESTYGTAVTPDVFVEALEINIDDKPNFEEVKVIRSWSTRQMVELNSIIRGEATVQLDFQVAGDLLYHFYGVAPDTTGAGPYTHTFPPSTGIPAAGRNGVSATLQERRDGSLVWQHAGCKMTGFGFEVSVDQSARAALSWIGKSTDNTASATTASYRDFDIIKPSHCTINVNGSAQDARSFSFNAGFPVDEPFKLGSTSLALEPTENDVIGVEGQFEVYFADMTEYDLFKNRSDVDVQLSATDGTHSLTVNMDKARFTEVSVPVSGRERLMATFAYRAFYNSDATENIQSVVVNDVATIP